MVVAVPVVRVLEYSARDHAEADEGEGDKAKCAIHEIIRWACLGRLQPRRARYKFDEVIRTTGTKAGGSATNASPQASTSKPTVVGK